MTAKDAIRQSLNSSQIILTMLADGLSDADILVRTVPTANHVAWQIGHIIASEHRFLTENGWPTPELPASFSEKHANDNAKDDAGFSTAAAYLDLYSRVRAATLAALTAVPDAELDRPTEGPMKDFAPNLGAMFLLMADHSNMHVGQFSVLRRSLGKPHAF